MSRLILLAAIALVLYVLFQRARSAPPHKRRGEYIKLGLGIAAVTVVLLALAGKMHWLGVALTGALVGLRALAPVLARLFPLFAAKLGNSASASGGQSSTVATDILQMQLDHESGDLSGEVLKGQFAGWRLADMDRSQLEILFAYCQQNDEDSLRLLDSYLQQRFPGTSDFGTQQPPPGNNEGALARREALAILGLEDGASEEDIVAAHRKLMQKMHPDRGGNDYLAAKINQAKDVLLG